MYRKGYKFICINVCVCVYSKHYVWLYDAHLERGVYDELYELYLCYCSVGCYTVSLMVSVVATGDLFSTPTTHFTTHSFSLNSRFFFPIIIHIIPPNSNNNTSKFMTVVKFFALLGKMFKEIKTLDN